MPATATKIVRDEAISHSPVKLVDEVILRAFSDQASDIHLEPGEHECRVRIRIDGRLIHLGGYKRIIHEEVVARLKVLSSLRTDVRTAPQDGRFKVNISGISLSIRISIVPSFFGEKCVLRLLPQVLQARTLESLGFVSTEAGKISQAILASHGMILVVGPTGSGKTTTLYSLIQKICSPDISIVTLEDPIEYSIPEITQIPIHANSNLTFATALRSVVRQDPDVIMVGEIRDTPTAELSIRAALTGHLVLSTLHTNDAITALPRLIDMGVEPFLVASTVRAVISQRLVRKICTKCAVENNTTQSEKDYFLKSGIDSENIPKALTRAKGCKFCRQSGYFGRTVVSEVLRVNEKIRDLVMQRASTSQIQKVATESETVSLRDDAVQKVISGVTTLEEIASVCSSQHEISQI